MRIELTYAAWKAAVLPLNYICIRDSEETRTLDPLIKSQLLYHLSYRVIRGKSWLGQLDSNQRDDRVKVCCLTAWLCPNRCP